jgi:glycosyltransferase involved in cell wall biosynthesis
MKKVLVIFKSLSQYRIDFLNQSREKLLREGIELNIIYGKTQDEVLRKDEVDLPWGTFIPNKTIKIGSKELYWQPCLKEIKKHDLVITEQANKLLLNYYLMVMRKFSKRKFAFWGHGRDMMAEKESFLNKFKSLYIKQCDWFFAYTEGVKKYLSDEKFPSAQITVMQNAIDTKGLKKTFAEISNEEIETYKKQLRIESNNIVLYCGAMYKEKRIQFVIDAAKKVKEQIPNFHLVVIGSGPDAFIMKQAAEKEPWIHYLGPKFGKEKVIYFKMSSALLMPGFVGLAILDAFATECPMITTTIAIGHSPEIEYLQDGRNGIMTEDTIDAYSEGIKDLLNNSSKLNSLKQGCKEASDKYTNEAMVANFTDGIIACLKS